MIVNFGSTFLQTITQAHVIPRPSKNSGLNPSGVPYSSQLNRPSEIIQTPFTSDAASYPIPDHTSFTNPSSIYNPTTVQGEDNGFSTDLSIYNSTMVQGDNNGFELLTQTAPHYDNEPDDFPYDANLGANLPSLVPSSLSNTDWYFPGERGVESTSHGKSCYDGLHSYTQDVSAANIPGVVPEQPLRPGEATRGVITPPVPVSTWRTALTGVDQICAPSALRGGTVIRVVMFSSLLIFLFTFVFRVPEEQPTFWQTAMRSVPPIDFLLPQPRLSRKASPRHLSSAIQDLVPLPGELQERDVRNSCLYQRGLIS